MVTPNRTGDAVAQVALLPAMTVRSERKRGC